MNAAILKCSAALCFAAAIVSPLNAASPSALYEIKGLAFTYTIEVIEPGDHNCRVFEADRKYAFHPGERFHLRIAANSDGFLYIFRRLADGKLVPFEPSPSGGGLPVIRFAEYVFPRNGAFESDEGPEPDELWILYSKTELPPVRITELNVRSYFSGQNNLPDDMYRATPGGETEGGSGPIAVEPGLGKSVIAYRLQLRRK